METFGTHRLNFLTTHLQGIKNSFENANSDFKNLLNFACHSMKFHKCHYAILHLMRVQNLFSNLVLHLKGDERRRICMLCSSGL